MLDKDTTVRELASLLHESPNNFYIRISFARYYYQKFHNLNRSFRWIWMCKIGMDNDETGQSFAVRLNNSGAQNALHVRQRIGHKGMLILNSFVEYLNNDSKLDEATRLLNSKVPDPLSNNNKK